MRDDRNAGGRGYGCRPVHSHPGAALVGDYFRAPESQGPDRARHLGLQQACAQIGGVAFVIAGGLLV